MDAAHLLVYGILVLGMSVFSGIAGAGAGFIVTPVAILLGLAPAQAVSTNKFNGIANAVGSLSGLRSYGGHISKRTIATIMALAFVIGLTSPLLIKSLESRWYQIILGVILLLMIPVMLYKHIGVAATKPSRTRKALGGMLLSVSLFLQGAFSGGLGTLVNVVLMGMLGMTANEAHITKRWSQLILNVTIIFGVLGSNLIVWPVAFTGMTASLVGSSIGARIAVKRGDAFAMHVLVALMGIAALVLIAQAL